MVRSWPDKPVILAGRELPGEDIPSADHATRPWLPPSLIWAHAAGDNATAIAHVNERRVFVASEGVAAGVGWHVMLGFQFVG